MNSNDAQDLDNGFIPVRTTIRTDIYHVLETYYWLQFTHSNSHPKDTKPAKEFDSQSFLFTLFNARSVRNKAMAIKDYVADNNINIQVLTETWLRPGNCDDLEVGILCPNGYRFLRVPRTHGRGVRMGWLFKDILRIKSVLNDDFQSFEVMHIRFRSLKCIRFKKSTCSTIYWHFRLL